MNCGISTKMVSDEAQANTIYAKPDKSVLNTVKAEKVMR
jgi:hypothetical protein